MWTLTTYLNEIKLVSVPCILWQRVCVIQDTWERRNTVLAACVQQVNHSVFVMCFYPSTMAQNGSHWLSAINNSNWVAKPQCSKVFFFLPWCDHWYSTRQIFKKLKGDDCLTFKKGYVRATDCASSKTELNISRCDQSSLTSGLIFLPSKWLSGRVGTTFSQRPFRGTTCSNINTNFTHLHLQI